jgi:signal transduction histidine kinase
MQETMVQNEKMMSVGGLAAGMAHEINNPLSGILQSAQVMSLRLKDDLPANRAKAEALGCDFAAMSEYLEQRGVLAMLSGIRSSAARAARIVANMLDFSRRSDGEKMPFDLNVLMDAALELCASDYDLQKRHDFRHIALERDYDTSLPPVPCTPTQIEQVVMNMLRNAAQAMANRASESPPARIALRTRREGDMARIDIEDNGPGMDDTTRRRIFEPFFTTKKPGDGTGLGLSVSYYIITNNHDGALEVESAPGLGTRFIIRLPLSGGESA